MRLPPRKKPGDPVLASDWNLLLEAIAARTPRPGTGLELTAASGGFAYSRSLPVMANAPRVPPFGVIAIEKTDVAFQVTLREGWVIERQRKTTQAPTVKFHMPAYGTSPLDATPRPPIPIAPGEFLWCKITTDPFGAIADTPQILVAASEQDGTLPHPPDPAGEGGEGVFFLKLLKLETEDGSPLVKVFQQSDIEHLPLHWHGENRGAGARVFREYDEAAASYLFRSVAGRESDGQIAVVEEEDLIRVHGNEKNGSLGLDGDAGSSEPLLAWKDGLVTTEGDIKLTAKEYLVCESGTPKTVKFLIVP